MYQTGTGEHGEVRGPIVNDLAYKSVNVDNQLYNYNNGVNYNTGTTYTPKPELNFSFNEYRANPTNYVTSMSPSANTGLVKFNYASNSQRPFETSQVTSGINLGKYAPY
jgi:hypothetical protein